MSEKHSLALKARWAKLKPDERKRRMKIHCSVKRWAGVSQKSRMKHMNKMNRARLSKAKI